MTGFPAWLVWALVHVALLIGFRSRVVVMISWIWNWLTNRRGARIVVGRTRCSAQTPSEDMASSASVQSRGSD
jgi:NADH dehydrogenase